MRLVSSAGRQAEREDAQWELCAPTEVRASARSASWPSWMTVADVACVVFAVLLSVCVWLDLMTLRACERRLEELERELREFRRMSRALRSQILTPPRPSGKEP